MKNKIPALIIIFLFLLQFGCSSDSKSEDDTTTPPIDNKIINRVLVIGIDGCRPDALMAAETPNLDKLMANGTYSLDARCLYTTSSGPGWTSMLNGVWQNKHKVVDNSYSGADFGNYPHFFKRIEDHDSEKRTVSIVQWNPINDNMANKEADVVINAETDEGVRSHVVNELSNNDPDVLFVQLSNVDFAGHGTGFTPNNPNYISAIETVDTQIGAMVAAVKARENYSKENWLILLSTDHGGLGTGHGGPSDEERTIFVVASGDNIPNKKIEAESEEVTIPPANNCLNSSDELWFEDAHVQVPHDNSFNFGDAQDFTLECRVRSTIAGDVGLVGKKNWTSGTNKGFTFSFLPSNNNFKVNIGDGTNRLDINAGEITDNEWHTISATFDRDGLLSVYVDGELKASASMASIGDINNDLPFTIGADGNLNWNYRGYVAEVRLFDTLLEESDIDEWKCKVLDNTHSKYANIVGHWKLTEGSGTDILDSGPNGHNGTLTNGEWRDATSSVVEIVKNYDNTPRTVDVTATALNHLCIPVQAAWNLESKSIINTDCSN